MRRLVATHRPAGRAQPAQMLLVLPNGLPRPAPLMPARPLLLAAGALSPLRGIPQRALAPPARAFSTQTPPVDGKEPAPAPPTPSPTQQPPPAQVAAVEPKKPLMQRIKDELHHYWDGSKLLWAEIKISTRLTSKVLAGSKLTRREQRQLRRTAGDLLRLVPFSVFIIVPFMELLLPVFIKVFPNMLPSTFESKFQEEEKKKKLLKLRLEMAKFLQDTVQELATSGSSRQADAAKEFAGFFRKVRNSGDLAATEDLIRVARKFEDELTLDNLSRPQLVSMCRYMGINAFGTDNFLRYQIRTRMRELKNDDKLIAAEGVESLSLPEMQHACQSRGIKTIGVSPARLREELQQWLDLHLKHQVPSSLLILSRAFVLTDKAMDRSEVLQATLSSLPDQVLNETALQISESQGKASFKQKLDVIEQQEELIADELEQEAQEEEAKKEKEELAKQDASKPAVDSAAATAAAASTSATAPTPAATKETTPATAAQATSPEEEEIPHERLKQLSEAISVLTSESAVKEEKVLLDTLKGGHEEYKEDLEARKEISETAESATSSRLNKRLEKMIGKIEDELNKYDLEVGSKLNILRADPDGKIPVAEIEQVYKMMKNTSAKKEDEERIRRLISKLDTDNDGMIDLQEILRYAQELDDTNEGQGTVTKDPAKDAKAAEKKKEESAATPAPPTATPPHGSSV